MNFSTSSWTGDTGQCNKSRWARACDLTWDGITNNSSVCDGVPPVQPTTSGNTWTPGSFSLPGTASTSELAAKAVPSTTSASSASSTTSATSDTSATWTPGSFSLPGTASTSELAAMAVPSQSS